MDTASKRKPQTLAELMPGLTGIFPKDAIQSLTAKKKPRPTIAATRTAEKVFKPMTIAEMKADIAALRGKSPGRLAQNTNAASARKKWNSSVKVANKIVSRTADGETNLKSVRKALNFQPPKSRVPKVNAMSNSRMTIMNAGTPKFHKPESKAKKSLYQARNICNISGICNIPETPLLMNNPKKSRMTIANKENIPNRTIVNKKLTATPESALYKNNLAQVLDTPLSNESWKSSCDSSFLQHEKDIEYMDTKTNALTEEPTLENIAEVTPPVSTPFKEYRNVKEFFNNSSDVMESSSVYHDNTIMCFDNPSAITDNGNREESVIVSICDMLSKATVSQNTKKISTELDDLLKVEKNTEINIKMIENGIKQLNTIRESQLNSLQYVRKLIKEKHRERTLESDKDTTITETTKEIPKITVDSKFESPITSKPCSVIKSCLKSPTYKIPKKNTCLRKKVFYKSMPNVSNLQSPTKDMGDRALSIYMKMKEHSKFLNTPRVKQIPNGVPDTPAITSHNLQKQLDKLYDEN